jgi:hypothetical protein
LKGDKTMTIHLPTSIHLQTQTTTAAYEAQAKRERLLRQAATPATLRSGIALFLHELAERLAPGASYPSSPQRAH